MQMFSFRWLFFLGLALFFWALFLIAQRHFFFKLSRENLALRQAKAELETQLEGYRAEESYLGRPQRIRVLGEELGLSFPKENRIHHLSRP